MECGIRLLHIAESTYHWAAWVRSVMRKSLVVQAPLEAI